LAELVRCRVAVIATPALPLAARRREVERVRRIGGLGLLAVEDPEPTAREAAFHETQAGLAWSEGPNVRIGLFLLSSIALLTLLRHTDLHAEKG
jgi:hypothetical protein